MRSQRGNTKCSPRSHRRLDGASQKGDRLQSGTTARVLVTSLLIHSHGHCPGGQQVRGGGPCWKGVEKKEVLIWVFFFFSFFNTFKNSTFFSRPHRDRRKRFCESPRKVDDGIEIFNIN